MYHGEQLSEDFYVGRNVDFFDYCDKDFMSLLEVDNMVEELGYGNDAVLASIREQNNPQFGEESRQQRE
ncbi:unnamed protein product [Malus baccata var. baccata]